MKDIQQLIKKNSQEGRYEDIFPKTFIDAVEDRETGVSLRDILSSFNMYFLTYMGSPEDTRLQLPKSLRRMGVWITYVTWDNTVHIEWYSSDDISDETFRSSLYWKEGTNSLVGDLSISAEGNWVINREDTDIPARGEKGITPVLRLGKNNRFQVSYNEGGSYLDITSEPIITQLRVHNNKLQKSLDLGKTWEDESDYISSYFREKDNKIQISKDKETWEDISDNIAAWFRWQMNDDNLGRIQISRDNNTWENFSPEFINRMLIKDFVSELPQDAEYGDIYMVGPYYNQEDSEHVNPYYRMWVMQDTWVDAGNYNKNTYNYNYNIRKTYASIVDMFSDLVNPIGTDGRLIKIGELVTVVNSTTPAENGYYSYEGSENGWLLQSGFSFEIVQTTGTDVNRPMSQKAVTDELALKIDKTSVKQVTGESLVDVMSQKAVTDEIAQLKEHTTVKVENLVPNSNFANGTTTGWWSAHADLLAENNSMKITANSSTQLYSRAVRTFGKVNNTVFYTRAKFKVNSSGLSSIAIIVRDGTGGEVKVDKKVLNPIMGETYELSGMYNTGSLVSNLTIFLQFTQASGSMLGKSVNVTEVMHINVSSTFGGEVEITDTKSMDSLIKVLEDEHLEGEVLLSQKQIISWQDIAMNNKAEHGYAINPKTLKDIDDSKLNKSDVKQAGGLSITEVMSQKAATILHRVGDNLVNKHSIVDIVTTSTVWVENIYVNSLGEEVSTSIYSTTEYIPIKPSKIYSLYLPEVGGSMPEAGIALYDIEKNYIKKFRVGDMGHRPLIVFNTTDDAVFARISTRKEFTIAVTCFEGKKWEMRNDYAPQGEYNPDPIAVNKIIHSNIKTKASENLLSEDLFTIPGSFSRANIVKYNNEWFSTDFIELSSEQTHLTVEYCRFLNFYDVDKNYLRTVDLAEREKHCFLYNSMANVPFTVPKYFRVTARYDELHLARAYYGSSHRFINEDGFGSGVYSLPDPTKSHFKDSLVNLLDDQTIAWNDGTIGVPAGTNVASTTHKSSSAIDVTLLNKTIFGRGVSKIAEYGSNKVFIKSTLSSNGNIDLNLTINTKYIRIESSDYANAFVSDSQPLNKVSQLRRGNIETLFNPDPQKVREIIGETSGVDEPAVRSIVTDEMDSYPFTDLVTQEILDQIVTEDLISNVADNLDLNVVDNKAPTSGYSLFEDNKDFKIWKPTSSVAVRGVKDRWAVKYSIGAVSFEITGGGIDGGTQVLELNSTNFPNLIEGSKVASVLLLGFDPVSDNPEDSLNLKKDVRACLITNKGQIYHNKAKKTSGFGTHIEWDESVVWDIEGRRLPSKTEDNDIYYLNPCLPDAAYELHPGINVDNGYGNGGFPLQKTMGGTNYNRFYQHARGEQNIPFYFMGGFAQNHKIAVIGTYRANKAGDIASRVCLFATVDGGRQWHNIQEYASDDSTNYGMLFNPRGNKLIPNGIVNNYSTNSLSFQKVTLNLPSEVDKEPSYKFNFSNSISISAINSTSSIRVTTSAPHGLASGNRIVIKDGSSYQASNFDFLRNNTMTANHGGNMITWRVVVVDTMNFDVYEYVNGANTNIPCRHIHSINNSKNNFVVGTGEIYPQGWVSMLMVETSDTWYPVGSLYELPYVRLTSTANSIQRTLGTLVIDDKVQSVIYASDDAAINRDNLQLPEGRVSTEQINSTGIYRGRLRDVDDINKFEIIYPAQQVAYLFQEAAGMWIFCGQQGELAISVDRGKSWRTYSVGAGPLQYPGGTNNVGVCVFGGWIFYKK